MIFIIRLDHHPHSTAVAPVAHYCHSKCHYLFIIAVIVDTAIVGVSVLMVVYW